MRSTPATSAVSACRTSRTSSRATPSRPTRIGRSPGAERARASAARRVRPRPLASNCTCPPAGPSRTGGGDQADRSTGARHRFQVSAAEVAHLRHVATGRRSGSPSCPARCPSGQRRDRRGRALRVVLPRGRGDRSSRRWLEPEDSNASCGRRAAARVTDADEPTPTEVTVEALARLPPYRAGQRAAARDHRRRAGAASTTRAWSG